MLGAPVPALPPPGSVNHLPRSAKIKPSPLSQLPSYKITLLRTTNQKAPDNHGKEMENDFGPLFCRQNHPNSISGNFHVVHHHQLFNPHFQSVLWQTPPIYPGVSQVGGGVGTVYQFVPGLRQLLLKFCLTHDLRDVHLG